MLATSLLFCRAGVERFFFETDDALAKAVAQLRCLGGRARKLLAESVAAQGITRTAVSQTALALENAGFVFVRDKGDVFEPKFEIAPSMAGEEALEALQQAEETAVGKEAARTPAQKAP